MPDLLAPVLDVQAVSKRFGAFQAVDGITLRLAEGERRALIGPNGAGKTTLFNLISGRLRPDSGEVSFRGRRIGGVAPSIICRMGVARTFQLTSVYRRLTVRENVQVSLFARHRRSHWLLRGAARLDAEEAMRVLEDVGIAALSDHVAALISYGDQKRLELAMALALQPTLLLLDEPTAGVEVQTRRDIVALIRRLCLEHGLTLLFCEHDMDAVFGISDRITVVHQGRILMEGGPQEVKADREVRSVYLGARHAGETQP